MKKITFTLLAFFVTCCMWQVNAQTYTATDTPLTVGPNSGTITNSVATATAVGVIGTGPGEYSIENVSLNIDHSWADDLDIRLVSPGGVVTHDLSTDNGGRFGLTPAADLVFLDGSANDVTTWGSFAPEADYMAEGGTFEAAFAGQPVNGDWTLEITDDTNGDMGNLNSYSISFGIAAGAPPVIACPMNLMVDTTVGLCSGVGNFADAIAIDPEDGIITAVQTLGLPSGSAFPIGDTTVEYTATDSDGNTASCQFIVTVTDTEAPMAMCQDITVELDAAGAVSIVAGDIDNGSTDNCGVDTLTMGVPDPGMQTTLPISFAAGNGQAGNMFDMMALNDITVDSFDVNSQAAAGVLVDFEVYFKTGSWIGSDMTAADWGLVGTVTGVASAGPGVGTPLGLALAIDVMAGDTVAFYVTSTDGANVFYTNGGIVGDVWASDANLELYEGAGKVYPFLDTFQPRNFNGNIIYSTPAGIVPFNGDFDCSNAGANTVTLFVTDVEGNVSSCESTVTVEDNTAPIITCIGEQVVGPFSTSAAPALAIPDNDPAGISTTMTVTDDFVITDLNVDLDISHTWVGDMIVTLESPAGTSVVIVDQMGVPDTQFGCAEDDLQITLDDEGAAPIEDECSGSPITGVFTPNNPLSAFDGESSMGVWTLTVSDNAGGDTGTINSWNLVYDFDPIVAPPFDVVLDAAGNATVNMADLILNIDEACGFDVTTVGLPPTANSLATLLDGGNGNFGNMFDINALTDVTMDSFDIHGDTGATFDVEVYAKAGTWVGFEADASAWTLIGTAPGVVSNGDGVVTPLGLDLGYNMLAGETHAFFVTPTDTSTGGFNYTDGTTVGAVFASDANLEFLEGAGSGIFDGNVFQPRIFNGNILYSTETPPSATLDFDCSQLGENTVDVVVTDASGNEAFCTATVNVLDETAPIITCVGPTTPTEMGTASDSPGTTINDNTTATTTLTVTDDFVMTDLNVDLDITHTWTGDMQITLESPAGTQVLIFDGGADGCSANDLGTTLDDESANGLACDPSGGGTDGDAFPEADYMPSNALSAFDGESTVGDWILRVEDTATGDTGTINSWGLTYSYDGAPTDAWPIYLGPDGTVTIDPLDLILDTVEACGIATAAADITEFFCDDIDAGIIDVTIFVSDASGNIDSCVAQIRVIDNLGPDITCPANQTVDPGVGSLFYEVPDYWANGEATATDNCTDPVTITSQDPAAGTLLPDGTYTITIIAEDEYGNESTCTFELIVESVLGLDENELDIALSLYPNPAREQVTISNNSNIQLEKATIYDLNGKLISQTDLSSMQGEKVINVSELATGVYVVQITSDESSAIKRLIKE
mgnify:CR=1 FL=1